MKTHLALAAGLVGVYFALAAGAVSRGPYLYDEADYMFAASLGPAAHYTDSPTLPIADFVRTGLRRGGNAGERMALSESIRGSRDVVFYRHWHGPLYFYPLMAVNALQLDEHGVRSAMLAIPALTGLAIYFGCVWLLPVAGRLAGLLSAALYLWDAATVRSTELAPHQLFVACYIAALFLLAKMMQTGARRYWYGALAASGLAFCTLEVTFVLILAAAVCGHLERKRLNPDRGFLARSAAVFAGAVFVAWPGAAVKLSFLKAYAFMAYISVFRKGAWGTVGFAGTWWIRFLNSPLVWAMIVFAALFYFRHRLAFPFLIYGALMILATLRVTTETPRYELPFLPALEVFAGITLANALLRLRAPVRTAVCALLCAALFLSTYARLRAYPPPLDTRTPALLSFVRERGFEDKRLLAPQTDVPTLHYYFPKTRLSGYVEAAPPAGALDAGLYDGVLLPGETQIQPRTK